MKKYISFLLAGLLSFPLSSCQAKESLAPQEKSAAQENTSVLPATSNLNNGCTILDEYFTKLSTQVLLETDVVAIGTFEKTKSNLGGYLAEVGGASFNVELAQSKDAYILRRTYSEPGLAPEIKEYAIDCISDGLLYGENVRGKFVPEGLLLLELNSGNEFIGPDLWVFLSKAKNK